MDRQRENGERRRRFGKVVRVRVDKELYEQVERLATDLGVPMSEVYRTALQRGVERLSGEWPVREAGGPAPDGPDRPAQAAGRDEGRG